MLPLPCADETSSPPGSARNSYHCRRSTVSIAPRIRSRQSPSSLWVSGVALADSSEIPDLSSSPTRNRLSGERSSAAQIRHTVAIVGLVLSRSEEHTSELQSLMRISYAVFCLKKKNAIL